MTEQRGTESVAVYKWWWNNVHDLRREQNRVEQYRTEWNKASRSL
jgi:hypothetical protein